MAWLKAKSDVKFDVQIEIQCAIGEDPAMCYEWYGMSWVSLTLMSLGQTTEASISR